MVRQVLLASSIVFALAVSATAADDVPQGKVPLKSAGPLAFDPAATMFIGDPLGAAVFAVRLDDTKGDADRATLNVEDIDQKVAAALGVEADDMLINDLAVNPASGAAYLSVSRGRGPDGIPVIMKVSQDGEIAEVPLDNVKYVKFELPNAPENKVAGEGRRRSNDRLESITDLAFVDGKLYVAGLSNEEFASKLRVISIPPEKADAEVAEADRGASVEIYHGSHGAYETRAPIRTFTVVDVKEAPHLLAAYTCTPLVKIPLDMLKPGEKIRGKTVAELGNHNRPLDMIVYQKDGKGYVLMANNARGMMKIPLEKLDEVDAITKPVDGTAGLQYQTLEDVEGVVQLDRLNYDNALILVQKGDGGPMSLKTMALP
jgi:hypothetical protein